VLVELLGLAHIERPELTDAVSSGSDELMVLGRSGRRVPLAHHMIDWGALASQLRAVANGDLAGWPAAQQALHPELVQLARRAPIGRLRDDRDAAHEVAARVLERLHAHEFRAIKRLFATETEPVVRAWIQVIVRTAAIDVMRAQPEYQRAKTKWISLATLASNPGSPAPASLVEKQREVERFLERAIEEAEAPDIAERWKIDPKHVRRLATKGERYLPVLRLVLAGHSYPEVATQLGFTRREVELVVEYIEELLQVRGFGTI